MECEPKTPATPHMPRITLKKKLVFHNNSGLERSPPLKSCAHKTQSGQPMLLSFQHGSQQEGSQRQELPSKASEAAEEHGSGWRLGN